MASYFRQVPNFEYVSRNPGDKYISEYIPVKNLFKRGKLREDIFGDLQFFEKYQIIGDERPDNVAAKFYNDSTLDWIVLLSNNILNIQTEWPLTQRTFDKVMLDRYGSYDGLYNGIHHHETIEIKNSLGVTVLKGGLRISPTWRSDGNFTAQINNKIDLIFSGNFIGPSNTVTVILTNGIGNLKEGDTVIINNVSENEYNGEFIVTSLSRDQFGLITSFEYELPNVPNVSNPTMSDPRIEEVVLNSDSAYSSTNSYYYEYWDPGLGYSVQVPSTSFVKPVTNYEYEIGLEEEKRNIFILKPTYLNVVFNDMEDLMTYKRGSQQYVSENLKRGDNIRLYE